MSFLRRGVRQAAEGIQPRHLLGEKEAGLRGVWLFRGNNHGVLDSGNRATSCDVSDLGVPRPVQGALSAESGASSDPPTMDPRDAQAAFLLLA